MASSLSHSASSSSFSTAATAAAASQAEYWLLKIPNQLHDQWEAATPAAATSTAAGASGAATSKTSSSSSSSSSSAPTVLGHIWIQSNVKPGQPRRVCSFLSRIHQ